MRIQRDYLGILIATGLIAAALTTVWLVGRPTPPVAAKGPITAVTSRREAPMEAERLQQLYEIRRRRAEASQLKANERCISGQKFRKVDNEWQQLGRC